MCNVGSTEMIHLSLLPPCGWFMTELVTVKLGKQFVKSTAHTGHFFTAAISKFIEIDWFLQIIVKLILPLNMKLERGLGGQWPVPTSKREAHGWL